MQPSVSLPPRPLEWRVRFRAWNSLKSQYRVVFASTREAAAAKVRSLQHPRPVTIEAVILQERR